MPNSSRAAEATGMIMIGDAILALVRPREHCLMWRAGPRSWRNAIDWCAAHPTATRGIAAAELGAGLWLALRQRPQPPPVDEVTEIRIVAVAVP